MAIWQYDVKVIPKMHDEIVSEEDMISWEHTLIPPEFESSLSQVIALNRQSYGNVYIYGDSDSTCVNIIKEQEAIVEISCRFDLRNLTKILLIEILELIKSINGVLYVNRNSFAPDLEAIVQSMKISDAAKFCENPLEYLSSCRLQ